MYSRNLSFKRKETPGAHERGEEEFMRYVILGGVAAGTKAAAKLKRCDRQAEVKVFTK